MLGKGGGTFCRRSRGGEVDQGTELELENQVGGLSMPTRAWVSLKCWMVD